MWMWCFPTRFHDVFLLYTLHMAHDSAYILHDINILNLQKYFSAMIFTLHVHSNIIFEPMNKLYIYKYNFWIKVFLFQRTIYCFEGSWSSCVSCVLAWGGKRQWVSKPFSSQAGQYRTRGRLCLRLFAGHYVQTKHVTSTTVDHTSSVIIKLETHEGMIIMKVIFEG